MSSLPHAPRILISIGELSADEHAAQLVVALRAIIPNAEFKAMGGRNLRQEGVETVVDSEHSASVMGFSEVLGSMGRIVKAYKTLKHVIKSWKPHLVIAIDYPDFNFRVIKTAKKQGCKVLYFIPPQVWAWRSGRVRFLHRYTDRVATIFPFEEKFFHDRGVPSAQFVGHPLFDRESCSPCDPSARQELKQSLGLDAHRPVLAIFPGSRKFEIERHLSVMAEGVSALYLRHPSLQCVINVASSIDEQWVRSLLPRSAPIYVTKEDSLKILRASDVGLLKSGTSNLQAMICELPFVMFYIASPFSAWVVRKLVQLKEYSIVNILRAGTVTELVQDQATASAIVTEVDKLLSDAKARSEMVVNFRSIKALFKRADGVSVISAYQNVAKMASDLLM